MFALTLNKWITIQRSTKLMVVLAILCIVDFVLTKHLVDLFGFEVEVNPLMYNLMVTFDSVYALLVVKLIALGMLAYGVAFLTSTHQIITTKRLEWMLWILVGAYSGVVGWSFYLVHLTSISG